MDIAALLQNHTETSAKNRSPHLAEAQLFAQLLDQHFVSHQETAGGADFTDHSAEDRDNDSFDHRDEGESADNQEDNKKGDTHDHGKRPEDPPGLAIALAVLGIDQGPVPPIAQQQHAATPTSVANTAPPHVATSQQAATPQQVATNAGIHSGRPTLQSAVTESKLATTPVVNHESAGPQHNTPPGAQITTEANPQLRSQAPSTVSSAATAAQEVVGSETSLRASRGEVFARLAQLAAELQPRPAEPKTAGSNTASTDQNALAERPNTGQTASPPQTLSAVKPAPTMVAAPLVSLRSNGLPFAGDDLMKLDLAAERGTASQPSPTAQAKTASNKTTAAHTRTPPGQQVAMQIRQAVKAGTDHIRIQLQPADLGKVDVRLTIVDESVQATITVDRPETLEQLQRDSRQLLRALEDAGLQADHNSLTFRHHGSDGQGPDNGETGSQLAGSPGDSDEPVDHASSETESPRAPRHDGLVSIEA